MPVPKLPSASEIIADPTCLDRYLEKVRHLPVPMLVPVLDQLKEVDQALGIQLGLTAGNTPWSPVEMAIANPKHTWMDTPHLHYLGEKIAAAVERSKSGGESAGLVVTMPPRHAKSHLCSVWTPFWFLARYPHDNVIIVTAEHNNSAKWGSRVRRLVELYGAEYGLKLNPRKVASDNWELTTGGGMMGVGAGGAISGNPAKLLICDDLIKNIEEAGSAYQREKIWDWWESTLLQRIEPDTTVIVIGTRYWEDDIIGRVLAHSAAGDGHRFELVNLAAKALAGDPLGRGEGEGLWTNHVPDGSSRSWGQEFYDQREKTVSPSVWASVYQQDPVAAGGNMVDPAWWRFYTPSEMPGSFDQECQSWDLSLDAEKKTDSRHAGLVLARRGAVVYVRDGFADHCRITRVMSTIRAWGQIYPKARAKLIERATAGVALQQTLHHEVAGILAWPPKGRQKGSKEACLDAIIPAIRSGNVLLPQNPDGTKPRWVLELIEECRQFPRGAYDDMVDTLSQGVGYLLPAARSSAGQDQREAASYAPGVVSPAAAHTNMLHQMMRRLCAPKIDAIKEQERIDRHSPVPPQRGLDLSRVLAFGAGTKRKAGSGMW